MGDAYEYQIGRVKYRQTELTWDKDQVVLELYNKITAGPMKDEEIRIDQLQPLLIKSGLMYKFLGVILDPVINARYIFSFKWISYIPYPRSLFF